MMVSLQYRKIFVATIEKWWRTHRLARELMMEANDIRQKREWDICYERYEHAMKRQYGLDEDDWPTFYLSDWDRDA
jgi:hypothetical protein